MGIDHSTLLLRILEETVTLACFHPPQVPNPSMAEVKALHTQIQDAISEVYNRHSHLLPELDGKKLTIV